MSRRKEPERICFAFDQLGLEMPLLRFGGFDCFRKTIPLPVHSHEEFEITYISEGSCTWISSKNEQLHLRGGFAALTQPGELHRGHLNSISPARLFWIGINPFLPDSCRNTVFTPAEMTQIGNTLRHAGNCLWKADKETAEAFESLKKFMELKKNATDDIFAKTLCRSTLCRLVSSIAASLSSCSDGLGTSRLISDIELWINSEPGRSMSVTDLALKAKMSPARFSEFFKRETGLSPADYIRRLRCEKSCEMMIAGGLSLTEIAYKLGFNSSQHFAGVFRKYKGISPSEFRKRFAR